MRSASRIPCGEPPPREAPQYLQQAAGVAQRTASCTASRAPPRAASRAPPYRKQQASPSAQQAAPQAGRRRAQQAARRKQLSRSLAPSFHPSLPPSIPCSFPPLLSKDFIVAALPRPHQQVIGRHMQARLERHCPRQRRLIPHRSRAAFSGVTVLRPDTD